MLEPALSQALQTRLAELASETGGVSLEEGFSERLAESIARFNEHAAAGHDRDFHRGETPIETFFNSFHGPVRSETSRSGEIPPISTAIWWGLSLI